MTSDRWPDGEPLPPYEVEHIATDPMHVKREMRYAVKRRSDGHIVSRYVWSGEAADAARRLSIQAGACTECGGTGNVIESWEMGGDGNVPHSATCPPCGGTGLSRPHNAPTTEAPNE